MSRYGVVWCLIVVCGVAFPAHAATFSVNSPAAGIASDCEKVNPAIDECTWEDAVYDANNTAGADTIEFAIDPPSLNEPVGVDQGTAASFYESVTIDGFTERPRIPGLPPHTPPIFLGGFGMFGAGSDTFTVRGVAAVLVTASQVTQVRLEGNWLGFGGFEFVIPAGGPYGFRCSECANVIIGTDDGDDGRNVISGANGPGISLQDSTDVTIQNNFIGLAPDGSMPVPNYAGIVLDRSSAVTIGGSLPRTGNVISGNGRVVFSAGEGSGIQIRDSSNVEILGNLIGTDAAGTEARPNVFAGIEVGLGFETSAAIRIGGTQAGAGNVISGNGDPAAAGSGFGIMTTSGSNLVIRTIQGNRLGTNAAGTAPLPNQLDNIRVYAASASTIVGGTEPGAGNLIAHSATGNGINVLGAADADRVSVLGNRIFDNHGGYSMPTSPYYKSIGLGIGLGGYGAPWPNDENDPPPYDTDGGANGRQNHPLLSAASSNGLTTRVGGRLRSHAATLYRIEIFSSVACDPLGYGEAEVFLGGFAAPTDGLGEFSFADVELPTPIPSNHGVVTATATEMQGGPGVTSEFSPCLNVPEPNASDLAVAAAATLFALARRQRRASAWGRASIAALLPAAPGVSSAGVISMPCEPDAFSVNGFEPCTLCAAGTFTPFTGAEEQRDRADARDHARGALQVEAVFVAGLIFSQSAPGGRHPSRGRTHGARTRGFCAP